LTWIELIMYGRMQRSRGGQVWLAAIERSPASLQSFERIGSVAGRSQNVPQANADRIIYVAQAFEYLLEIENNQRTKPSWQRMNNITSHRLW